MTKDKTVTMSRELAQWAFDSVDECIMRSEPSKLGELRAILATPVVERQEPVGEVADMKYNRVQFYRATGDTSKPYLLPGTKLYTSPPAPVKLPTKHEISVVVWNEWVKAQCIPGVSGFNAAEFAVEAVIEKIKELNP